MIAPGQWPPHDGAFLRLLGAIYPAPECARFGDVRIIVEPPDILRFDFEEHLPHHWALVQVGLTEDQVINRSVDPEGIEVLQSLHSHCVGSDDEFVFGSRAITPNRFDDSSREMSVITVGEDADRDLRHDGFELRRVCQRGPRTFVIQIYPRS